MGLTIGTRNNLRDRTLHCTPEPTSPCNCNYHSYLTGTADTPADYYNRIRQRRNILDRNNMSAGTDGPNRTARTSRAPGAERTSRTARSTPHCSTARLERHSAPRETVGRIMVHKWTEFTDEPRRRTCVCGRCRANSMEAGRGANLGHLPEYRASNLRNYLERRRDHDHDRRRNPVDQSAICGD